MYEMPRIKYGRWPYVWLDGTETWGVFYRHDPFGCSPIPGLDCCWLTSLLAGLYCGFNKFSVALISRPSRRSNSSTQKNCGWTKPDLLRPPAYLQAITLRAMPSQYNSFKTVCISPHTIRTLATHSICKCHPSWIECTMYVHLSRKHHRFFVWPAHSTVEWRCDDWI